MARHRERNHRPLLTGRLVTTEADGRICAHQGCDTILSHFNRSGTCGIHDGWANPRRPTRKIEPPDT
jgi:hypothetical protein